MVEWIFTEFQKNKKIFIEILNSQAEDNLLDILLENGEKSLPKKSLHVWEDIFKI